MNQGILRVLRIEPSKVHIEWEDEYNWSLHTKSVERGNYPNMAHLTEFEQRMNKLPIPAWLQPVSTPLIWREWAKSLGGTFGSRLQTLHLEWNSPLFSLWFRLRTPPM